MPELSTAEKTGTDSPETVDSLVDFSPDYVPEVENERGKQDGPGPEKAENEKTGEATEATAESDEGKPESTQEADAGQTPPEVGDQDKSSPDARVSDAQRKMHEAIAEAQAAKQRLAEIERTKSSKQEELYEVLLQNAKSQNQPKQPTQEEVMEKFEKVAQENPAEAVKLMAKHVFQTMQQSEAKQEQPQDVAAIAKQVAGQYMTEFTMKSNTEHMQSTHKDWAENLPVFHDFLKNQFSVLGDPALVNRAINGIVSNRDQLKQNYDRFLLVTKGPQALEQQAKTKEAVIAEKLAQNAGPNGNGQTQEKKSMKDFFTEDITPGFNDYFLNR